MLSAKIPPPYFKFQFPRGKITFTITIIFLSEKQQEKSYFQIAIVYLHLLGRSQSYQTLFLWKQRNFLFSATKLGCLIINTFFLFTTNSQAYHRKSKNEEKQSLVGSTPEVNKRIGKSKFYNKSKIFEDMTSFKLSD